LVDSLLPGLLFVELFYYPFFDPTLKLLYSYFYSPSLKAAGC